MVWEGLWLFESLINPSLLLVFGLLIQPFFSSYLHHKDRNKVSNILCMDKWGKGLIGTNQNDST